MEFAASADGQKSRQAFAAAKTFGELLPYLKQHPDFKWSTGGVGSLEHLTIAALNKQIGASAVIAAYNGVGPGTAAAVAGEVNGALAPLPGVRGSVEAGTLRALAVTSAVRMPQLPNVPTVAESGFPGFESYNWQGIWGPKQMPKELVNNIHDKIVKALANAATKERIAAGGFAVPPTKTPEQFAAYVKSEVAKYDPILTDLNLKGSQ